MTAHLDRAREMAECAAAEIAFHAVRREEWRPVIGFEDRYEVSSQGRMRRLAGLTSNGRFLHPQMMTPRPLNTGYLYVGVKRAGVYSCLFIHRQMLLAFEGPPPGDRIFACHNNGIKTDNRLENLRWDTPAANSRDAVLHGQNVYASRTHCIYGHEFTPENTIDRAHGWRACRVCKRRRNTEATERRRADRVTCARCGMSLQRVNLASHQAGVRCASRTLDPRKEA